MAGVDAPGVANTWFQTTDLKSARQRCIGLLLRELGIAVRNKPNLNLAQDLELAYEAMYFDNFGDVIANIANVATVPDKSHVFIDVPIPAVDNNNCPAPRWVRVLFGKDANGFRWAICTSTPGYDALVPPPVFGV